MKIDVQDETSLDIENIEHKIQTHLKVIADVFNMLPISKIILEVASFDIQKIKNPDIKGEQYQQGEQLNFWNIREYVLYRDGHVCQGKKGCKNKILNVHHIESRKTKRSCIYAKKGSLPQQATS